MIAVGRQRASWKDSEDCLGVGLRRVGTACHALRPRGRRGCSGSAALPNATRHDFLHYLSPVAIFPDASGGLGAPAARSDHRALAGLPFGER